MCFTADSPRPLLYDACLRASSPCVCMRFLIWDSMNSARNGPSLMCFVRSNSWPTRFREIRSWRKLFSRLQCCSAWLPFPYWLVCCRAWRWQTRDPMQIGRKLRKAWTRSVSPWIAGLAGNATVPESGVVRSVGNQKSVDACASSLCALSYVIQLPGRCPRGWHFRTRASRGHDRLCRVRDRCRKRLGEQEVRWHSGIWIVTTSRHIALPVHMRFVIWAWINSGCNCQHV